MRTAVRLAFLAAALSAAAPALARVPTIAVLPADTDAASPARQAQQSGVAHLLQSELLRGTRAQVVSRRETDRFLEELSLAAAGLAQPEAAQRFGRAVSADYLALVRLGRGGPPLRADISVLGTTDGLLAWQGDVFGSDPASLAASAAAALAQGLRLPAGRDRGVPVAAPATLAVLDFRRDGAASDLDQHAADLGDLLSAHLSALGVPLVERARLALVLDELAISASGLVRPAGSAQIGRLVGARYLLDTSMVVWGGEALFDSQLVQTETGLVVASCRVRGEAGETPALMQSLAQAVAAALRTPATEESRQQLAQQTSGSIEASLHAAAGWRLGEAGRTRDAIAALQQAVYLDPGFAWAWRLLGEQYRAEGDEDRWTETLRRYLAAAEGTAPAATLAKMAAALAGAEITHHRFQEAEAAARLSLRYRESEAGLTALLQALVRERRLRDALAFCETLARRRDLPLGIRNRAWFSLVHEIMMDAVDERDAPEALTIVAHAIPALRHSGWWSDRYASAVLSDVLLMACNQGRPDWLQLDRPLRLADRTLGLAKEMTECERMPRFQSRGWFLIGLLSYKLGRPQQALDALARCLVDYPTAVYDNDGAASDGPVNALVYYLLGRVYQDLFGDREKAIQCYQQVLYRLSPGRAESVEAERRLLSLGGEQLPFAPWLRRVGGAGQWIEEDQREELLCWLRSHHYDLRLQVATPAEQLAGQGIHLLLWRGRSSDYPRAEELRAFVAGGGRLLIAMGARRYTNYFESHGPYLRTNAQSLDQSLNWLLGAFGMTISARAEEAQSQPLLPGPAAPHLALTSPRYSGAFFPLRVPAPAVLLSLPRPGGAPPAVVAASARFGLGKVVVVSFREWFVGGDLFRLPEAWQPQLLQAIFDWFGEESEAPSPAARAWQNARLAVSEGLGDAAAVAALDEAAAVGGPAAEDARYRAACLLMDRLGDRAGAARRLRQVAASGADSWLVRTANLRLGVAAVRAGDERSALPYLRLAAGDRPDALWGQARLAMGDLRLAQGDYLGAAQAFREVADQLGHSEERFRALFGLAYALRKQAKPAASARVYEAIAVEFGKAPLPDDMEARWPDPWSAYFPPGKRPAQPTVADAVAAARPAP